jgi:DNA modification methylase
MSAHGGGPLRSIGDVLRTLDAGAYTLGELYELVEQQADIGRNNGFAPSTAGHLHDPKWRHRVRCWLANQQRAGKAWPLKRAVWAIERRASCHCCMLLIGPNGELEQVELRVADAVELLEGLEDPIDAVITDPPWGLQWDEHARHLYTRDTSMVLGGYVDVPATEYLAFSRRWIGAAAHALRPGGQLIVITGPQSAAHVQIAAEEHGLSWVSTIAAVREFVAPTRRRPAPAHWAITVMCRGNLRHRRRVFHAPQDQRRSRNGGLQPQDMWINNGRSDRPGLLRYATMLPARMALRIVATFTDEGEHVCDPMLGGGEIAHACRTLHRRFTGGDLNEVAVAFTAARLLSELVWPEEQKPALFTRAA